MKKKFIFWFLIFILLIFCFSILVVWNFYDGRCPEHWVYPKKNWRTCSFWEAYKFIVIEDIYTGWFPAIYWYPPSINLH